MDARNESIIIAKEGIPSADFAFKHHDDSILHYNG